MGDRTVTASTFKARCLALMDEVRDTGRSLVVTKHGRPVVRVAPFEEPESLLGSVEFLVDDERLLMSTGERWTLDED